MFMYQGRYIFGLCHKKEEKKKISNRVKVMNAPVNSKIVLITFFSCLINSFFFFIRALVFTPNVL